MDNIKIIATAYDDENSCEYIEFDENLSILKRKTIYGIKNASSIVKTPDGYVIAEEEKESGKIHLLNKKLEIIKSLETGVSGIVYLDYIKKINTILGGSYTNGEMFSIKDGKVAKYKANSSKSKLHCVCCINEILYLVDCGEDKIHIYNGNFEYKECFTFEKSIKPRHLVEYNNKIYVICENSNEIYMFAMGVNGELKLLDKCSTLISKNVDTYASTMCIKDDVIYCLNRGNDTITLIDIIEEKLYPVKEVSVLGEYPWNIAISDLGQVFVANQRSGEIVIFNMVDKYNLEFEKRLLKPGVNNILIV